MKACFAQLRSFMATKKKTKSRPEAAGQAEDQTRKLKNESRAAQEHVGPDICSVAGLKWCGERLDEKPYADRRLGPYTNSPEAMSWREYLMFKALRIRDKDGQLREFALNRAQKDMERTSTKRNIVLKARQLGITTYVAGRFFINTITREGTLSVQVAHDQRSAEEIFRIVHRLLENLPAELRNDALMTSRANVRQIIFPKLDSEYRVETAADPNAGRGLTIHNLHCSEVARWPRDVAETLASLRAAVPPDGEIFLESTPNGAGGTFYDEWQRAAHTGYTRHFYPWWWDPAYQRPVKIARFTEEEVELIKKHGLTAEQIAFRREVHANFRNRAREEFAEDAESCFVASGDCVFDAEVIEQRLRQLVPMNEEAGHGQLLTFFPPIPAVNGAAPKQYIIGVDPAGGGTTGDYSCAQVIEVSSGMQVAELHGHFPPQELAARVSVLAQKYNDAMVVIERNNHGHAVIAHLTLGQAYLNLYKQGAEVGWLTTVLTRPQMLEHFGLILAQGSHMLYSPRLLQECRTFIRYPDGSCSAAPGAHDDTVMAMAIAQQVRAQLRVQVPKSADLARYTMLQAA
jgi:Terminase RNaseH-like domain